MYNAPAPVVSNFPQIYQIIFWYLCTYGVWSKVANRMQDTPLTRWSAAKPASLLHWGKALLQPRGIFLLDPHHYFSQLIKADLKVKLSCEDVLGRKIHGCSVEEKSCDLQSEGYPSDCGISVLRSKENGIRSNQQKRCLTCPLHPWTHGCEKLQHRTSFELALYSLQTFWWTQDNLLTKWEFFKENVWITYAVGMQLQLGSAWKPLACEELQK